VNAQQLPETLAVRLGRFTKFDYENKDHEVVARPDPLIVGRALAD
jgi:hypothetical protein